MSEAESELKAVFEEDRLDGSFLDAGSGSGLFSRAALNLGADVVAFDYDSNSVETTRGLLSDSSHDNWRVEQGDLTDTDYVNSLGDFDYVYCWGVAHHTGEMWTSVENAATAVAPGGKAVIRLYNRVPENERAWNTHRAKQLKRLYHRVPAVLQPILVMGWAGLSLTYRWLNQGDAPWTVIRDYQGKRGMSYWHDLVDWCGGWPFEAATPEEVTEFVHKELDGFDIVRTDIRSRTSPTAVNVYTLYRES